MFSSRATLAFSQLSRHVKTTPGVTLGGMSYPRSFYSPAYKRDMKRQKARTVPTVPIAKAMAARYETMDNETLVTIAAMRVHDARSEVLKRHIMAIDNVSYDEANVTFATIAARNRRGMAFAALPYQIGMTAAVGGALASVPMVFDLSTAEWFNRRFVTTDVPEPKDLETFLEVGAWTWSWMEPVLGHVSFFLLCLQFSRAQLQNLGIAPFTQYLKKRRAQALSRAFPQYDPVLVESFSRTDEIMKSTKV